MLRWILLVITFAAALRATLSQIKMMASGPKEGKVSSSFSLTCTVTGTPLDSPKYAWNSVRQTPGGQLQFIGWIYPFGNNTGYAPTFQGRANFSADKIKGKNTMKLHDLTASDTATYFCTRQNTVGELLVATDRLVFGTGIPLSLQPNTQEGSAPEVIVLKSKEPKQHDNKVNVACLARTFYPKNISLDVPKGVVVYDLKAPLVTSEGTYSTTKVFAVEPDTEVTCRAQHRGTKGEDSVILAEEKTEGFGRVNVCNLTDASKKANVKMEKMNMLFMGVLGLRVLLAKSIILNTLMSTKLFLF
ncbi:PREDICTED: Ig heavy chain Mem5-like [Acanthisitta chloris]|uniref:Ig heavy chain Mem5-like n=1 Tax=Acanthisitta chloris TaxID=57068 RepID=UPI0004F0D56B|nr:PREDICTED: Ig heavy chain Mem5-like [Acanthisitta chloris]